LGARDAGSTGFLIHTSGTGVLLYEDDTECKLGVARSNYFDDWDGIQKVTVDIPDSALHRNVDKIVLSLGIEYAGKIKTAIVCPPTIYGVGRGPDNIRSIQLDLLTRYILKRKKAAHVGEGANIWSEVHVRDLSVLFLLLLEDAAKGGEKASWGPEGYYFAENGEYTYSQVSAEIASQGYKLGLLESAEVDNLHPEEARKTMWSAAAGTSYQMAYLVGMNSRSRAIRARRLLGWECKEKRVIESIPDLVKYEASLL
jgi:nucleoside-diphosphate-sugar epimerase